MIVKFIGHKGVRIIGSYRWDESNDWTVDVDDPEILEDIRTYPRPGQWEFPNESSESVDKVEDTAVSTQNDEAEDAAKKSKNDGGK